MATSEDSPPSAFSTLLAAGVIALLAGGVATWLADRRGERDLIDRTRWRLTPRPRKVVPSAAEIHVA